MTQPQNDPQVAAKGFVDADKQVTDVAAALEGARAILVERFAEDADLIGKLREDMWSNGVMVSTVRKGKKRKARSSRITSIQRRPPQHALASLSCLPPRRGRRDARAAVCSMRESRLANVPIG